MRKPPLPPLALRLRQLLAERDWTPYRLSAESGVSAMTLSRILAGQANVWWSTVEALADALGVSTEEFRARR